jgi:transketolase
MRNELINLINKTLKNKKNSYFLTADLGYSVLENLQKNLRKRFINVGISENNMLLLAVGLSEINKNLVYAYSISSFLILRPAEIIRNYISNERRNIRLIGVGSGVSYSNMGKSHHNLDDINYIYSLKNILILNPANLEELNYLYKKFLNYYGPIYFRINKTTFSQHKLFKRYNNIFVKKGKKSNLIVSGAILNYIIQMFDSKELKKINIISIPVMNVKYSENLKNYLVKGNTLFITDSSKTIFFEDIYMRIKKFVKEYEYKNFDLDHRNIKYVEDEKGLLSQMGLKKKIIKKFLLI